MLDPEYYIGVYEQRNTVTGEKVWFRITLKISFLTVNTDNKNRQICRPYQLSGKTQDIILPMNNTHSIF